MITQAEVQPYLDDYRAATGATIGKCVCPLTLRACELDEICNGHIINHAVGYRYNATVLIYGKADHFFGSRVETAFIDFIRISGMSGFQLLQDERGLNV